MTQQHYSHIEMLADRSGSMVSIKGDMDGGIATFIQEQRANNVGKTTFGFRQFDSQGFEQKQPPLDVALIETPPTIEPRGGTPLYDAIGWAVSETGEWLAGLPEDERPSRVFFVIVTDGLENASKEWTREKVFEVVKRQEEQWNWTFVYLGANQDAMSVGSGLGSQHNTTYSPSPDSVKRAYAGLALAVTATHNVGSAFTMPESVTDEDKGRISKKLRQRADSQQ